MPNIFGKDESLAEDVRQWKIWRVPSDGRAGSRLIESNAIELFPQFSPDNSRIAFQSTRSGKYQIWTTDADGKNLQQLTDTPFPAGSARFSPDGSLIAFNQVIGEDFANYIISATGGTPRRISPEGVQEDFPIWSADGKYIYFSSTRTGESNIWKMKADGDGEAIQITKGGAYRVTPAPDGITIFFTKTEFAEEFWRVLAEGGTEEIVPGFTTAGFFGSWIMSEAGIYFISSVSDKNFKLKFYDFTDGQVKNAPGDYKIPPNLDGNIFATDGNILLCQVIEQTSRLMFADLP